MTTPRLPPYVPPSGGLGRPSATDINASSTTAKERALSVAGFGLRVPLIYGEDRVGGVYLAGPIVDANGGLVMAIAWSIGEPYGIQGVQSLMIDGAVATHQGSGNAQLYIQHYDGTQTTADTMLSTRITAFGDTFTGIAYSAIRVPSRASGGIPTIEAVVRGRKVWDPRTSSASWSLNPGLAIRDIVTNANWGMGRSISGDVDVANHCDDLIDGQPRCQIGLTITNADTEDGLLSLLSAYAECLYEFDGDTVLLVPDAPVTEPDMALSMSQIRQGTLRLSGLSLSNAPTSVTVEYVAPGAGVAPWPTATQRTALPGVDTGTVDDTPSDISMPGIRRLEEAKRKSGLRLARLQVPGTVAWQMFDEGLIPEKGDVVDMPIARGMSNLWTRVLSKEMIRPGTYQLSGEVYTEDAYDPPPDPEVPPVPLPVGAIVPLYAGDVPAGFTRWTAGDGKWIRAGAEANQTGGLTSAVSITTNTNPAGIHAGSADGFGARAGTGRTENRGSNGGDNHVHELSTSIDVRTTAAPRTQTLRLVKKTGTAGLLPKDTGLFAFGQLLSTAITAINNYSGRLLASGASPGASGVTYPYQVANVVVTPAGAHIHGNPTPVDGTSGPVIIKSNGAVGNHIHTTQTLQFEFVPRAVNVALYVATADAEVVPGAVIAWEEEEIPDGWRLCTEINDLFVRFSSVVTASQVTGDNLLKLSGITNPSGAHSHGQSYGFGNAGGAFNHDGPAGDHSHSISYQQEALLPYRTLQFLEYVGEAS